MTVRFDLPEELADFVWDTAVAPARVVPGASSVHAIGPGKSQSDAIARSVMVRLIQAHVWCKVAPTQNWGTFDVAIHFGPGHPFGADAVLMPLTLIGQIIDRHPSSLSRSVTRYDIATELKSAEAHLRQGYADGTIPLTLRLQGKVLEVGRV